MEELEEKMRIKKSRMLEEEQLRIKNLSLKQISIQNTRNRQQQVLS